MNSTFLRYHLPAIVWALTIFVCSSVPGSSIPNIGIFSHDKLLHAAVFFVLAALIYRSLTAQSRWPAVARHASLWTLAVTTFYGISDEFHQLFVTGRNSDYRDLIADVVGALAFLALIGAWNSWRKKRGPA